MTATPPAPPCNHAEVETDVARAMIRCLKCGKRASLREERPAPAPPSLDRAELERLRYVHGGDMHVCDWKCHA